MSRGHGERGHAQGRQGRNQGRRSRSSRTSTRMTIERARAIQFHADKTGTNQDFKSRTMSAAERNEKS